MLNAFIISREKDIFKGIESVLVENGIKTDWSDTGVEVLSMLMEEPNDKLCYRKPTKNRKFHVVYEGLSVLMQFSVAPGRKEAQKLIEHMINFIIPQANHSI